MARKGTIERNKAVERKIAAFAAQRTKLRAKIRDKTLAPDERFEAQVRLAALPRNSSKTRYCNRCLATGRVRAYYRRFQASRIILRELASRGMLPGVTKASW